MSDGTRRTGRLGGIDLLAQEMADIAYRSAKFIYDRAEGDSPIERLFYAGLICAADQRHRSIEAIYRFRPQDEISELQELALSAGELRKAAYCQPQMKVAGWRVDYVLFYPQSGEDPYNLKRLLIECDGHEFHERTKEQARRDRARDRLAQYEGLPILRFTGSEIWNDPLGCGDEVLAFMERR